VSTGAVIAVRTPRSARHAGAARRYTGAMRSSAFLLAVVLLVTGCASSSFSPAGERVFPPHAGPVAVLDRLPASGEYELVGIVTVHGVNLSSDARMLEQLQQRAAARGADAVVPQGKIRERAGGDERVLAAHAIRLRRP
jgi:hypothetical protein